MSIKRMLIAVAVSMLVLTLIPSFGLAAGGTISGKVAFPPKASLPAYINRTADINASTENVTITKYLAVSDLTIYAFNVRTGIANVTNPEPDGTYKITVREDGTYRIFVSPNAVTDVTIPGHMEDAQYPNEGDRVYMLEVKGDISGADINYFAPGKYVPPNGLGTATPAPTAAPTPTPTPGFAALLALGAFAAAAVLVCRHKM